MWRGLNNSAIGVASLMLALTACGGGSNNARPDYGFKGSTTASFELRINTGKVVAASSKLTLTDGSGKKTAPLDTASCTDLKGAEAFPIKVKGHIMNPTNDLDVEVKLSVSSPNGSKVDDKATESVAIVWLANSSASCQTTKNGSFASTHVKGAAKGPDGQAQGYMILPGGADRYDGYTLNITTNAGEVYDVTHAKPYGGSKTIGATVDLVP